MNNFSGYEEYCGAFMDSEKRVDAELIYYSRCWLARVSELAAEGEEYFGTDNYSFGDFCVGGKDALSEIVCSVESSALYISRNLREKIVRENDLIPIYQVKEINSAGMNWISRRPGRTVREKLSGSSNVMGVRRRMSVDTGENRLFLAFFNRLSELIELKNSCLPKHLQRQEESDFLDRFASFLRSDEASEIARWENLPPNNTLLSDRHYRVVWNGWTRLRKLDGLVERDCGCISSILTTVFFWKLFSAASERYYFPQTPVVIDYDSFSVSPVPAKVSGIANDQTQFLMSMGENKINIFVDGIVSVIKFTGRSAVMHRGDQQIFSADVTADDLDKIAHTIIKKLCFAKKHSSHDSVHISADSFFADIFSNAPYYIFDEKAARQLGFRFASKRFSADIMEDCCLSLAESKAISTDNTEKMITPFSCSDDNDAYVLFSDISRRIDVKQFCFLFPDSFNEFRLTPIRKAARLFYQEIDALPQSIGAVFGFETTEWFINSYTAGDLLIAADIVGNELTLTPIKGVIDSSIDGLFPERRPIVWERYPTVSYNISAKRGERFSNDSRLAELFPGEMSEAEKRIPLLVNDNWSDVGTMNSALETLCIDRYLEDYIQSHSRTAKTDIKVLSLSDGLYGSGSGYPMFRIPKELCVKGHQLCSVRSRQAGKVLWKDHLPNLSIRQVCSIFDLVKNQTVIPRPKEEILIKIENLFTLPAGKESYSFELMQEDATSRMKYQAVLEHRAFPLKSPVKCRLVMKYRYGADDPYTLTFTPLDRSTAGFSEVTAKWKDNAVDDYSYSDTVYPEFPLAPDINMLRSYPPRPPHTESTNLFERVKAAFKPDALYLHRYYRLTGKEEWKPDKNNSLYTNIIVDIDGEQRSVQLYDNNGMVQNADEIFFQAELVKNTFYRAKYVITDYDKYAEYIFLSTRYCCSKWFTGSIFALSMILAGGRGLGEYGYPVQLKEAVQKNIGYVWQAYKRLSAEAENNPGANIDPIRLSTVLSILCLLYDEMDDDLSDEFYDFLIYDMAEGFLRSTNSGKKLNTNIGYAIGPCVTEAQKKLFEKSVEICMRNPYIGINILSRAIWKNPTMAFNADAEYLLECIESAVNLVAEFGEKCSRNSSEAAERVPSHIPRCLEYILAVFRLREKNDEGINVKLRCGSPMIEKLREALYNVVMTNDNKLFRKIDESVRVKLEMSNSSNENVPGIISAIMHYAVGTLENDSIKISGISEEEGGSVDL